MSVQSCGLSRHDRLVVAPKEAWAMLGVSNSKGYELLAAGELESLKFGRARRNVVASIHELIKRSVAANKSVAV